MIDIILAQAAQAAPVAAETASRFPVHEILAGGGGLAALVLYMLKRQLSAHDRQQQKQDDAISALQDKHQKLKDRVLKIEVTCDTRPGENR